MVPVDPPVTLERLGWQMQGLEKNFAEFREEQRAQIKDLGGKVDGLAFVRSDVYQSDTRALWKAMDSVKDSMATNWRLTWALFALLLTAILTVLAGLVRAFG